MQRSLADADLVIGAVLMARGGTPVAVDEEMVAALMPVAVIVDVAINQGGWIETIQETTRTIRSTSTTAPTLPALSPTQAGPP